MHRGVLSDVPCNGYQWPWYSHKTDQTCSALAAQLKCSIGPLYTHIWKHIARSSASYCINRMRPSWPKVSDVQQKRAPINLFFFFFFKAEGRGAYATVLCTVQVQNGAVAASDGLCELKKANCAMGSLCSR